MAQSSGVCSLSRDAAGERQRRTECEFRLLDVPPLQQACDNDNTGFVTQEDKSPCTCRHALWLQTTLFADSIKWTAASGGRQAAEFLWSAHVGQEDIP